MTLTDLLDALDGTLAAAATTKPQRRQVVLTVHSGSPHLLGESGWRMPDDPHDARPQYGFTLRQVQRMRQALGDALLDESGVATG